MSKTSTMLPTWSEPTKKALLNEGVEIFSWGGSCHGFTPIHSLPLFFSFLFAQPDAFTL